MVYVREIFTAQAAADERPAAPDARQLPELPEEPMRVALTDLRVCAQSKVLATIQLKATLSLMILKSHSIRLPTALMFGTVLWLSTAGRSVLWKESPSVWFDDIVVAKRYIGPRIPKL